MLESLDSIYRNNLFKFKVNFEDPNQLEIHQEPLITNLRGD